MAATCSKRYLEMCSLPPCAPKRNSIVNKLSRQSLHNWECGVARQLRILLGESKSETVGKPTVRTPRPGRMRARVTPQGAPSDSNGHNSLARMQKLGGSASMRNVTAPKLADQSLAKSASARHVVKMMDGQPSVVSTGRKGQAKSASGSTQSSGDTSDDPDGRRSASSVAYDEMTSEIARNASVKGGRRGIRWTDEHGRELTEVRLRARARGVLLWGHRVWATGQSCSFACMAAASSAVALAPSRLITLIGFAWRRFGASRCLSPQWGAGEYEPLFSASDTPSLLYR